MRLELVAPPEKEPVTLAEARLQVRADPDVTLDDGLLTDAIQAAREEVERDTSRALVTQSWRLKLDCFPASGVVEFPLPPLGSVTSVKYIDVNGTEQTLSSSEYVVDTSGVKGRLYLAYEGEWPITRDEPNAVRIVFVAGYGAPEDVPAAFRLRIKSRVATHYAIRENVVVGTIASVVPTLEAAVMGERVGL